MAPKRARTKANAKANPRTVDRISKLPDPIIHRILSLVPTIEVVRMSVLSKHWRRLWYSVPAFNFSDTDRNKYFPSSGADGFYNCVNKCLEHRKAASRYICDSVVTRFRFHVECPQGRAALDECLAFAIRSKVIEELDLRVTEIMKYSLPEAVLNMRSLSVLKLENLVLDCSYSAITFPVLKHFSLMVLTLQLIWDIEQIHVEAKNLVSFKYHGLCRDLDISSCTAIRNLSLRYCSIGKQSLENLIFGLPVLVNFTLGKSDRENHITFCSQSLKSIRLEYPDSDSEDDDVFEATIEAPNLTSVFYNGNSALSLSLNSQLRVSPRNVPSKRYL